MTTQESETSQHTLFVSSLPYDTKSQDLEEFFSEIGPIRSCFVVSDKQDASKNNGCGYVIYADPEDASRAIKELKKVEFQGKRRLRIQFAIRKKLKSSKSDSTVATVPIANNEIEDPSAKDASSFLDTHKDKSTEEKKQIYRKSLLLSHLPTDVSKKQLYKKVRKYGTIKNIVFPLSLDENEDISIPMEDHKDAVGDVEKETTKDDVEEVDKENDKETTSLSARILYATEEEAQYALLHLHQHVFKGNHLEAILEESTPVVRGRLMLKNLSFHCVQEDIKRIASPFGPIKDISIPLNDKNRNRGFAFVEFEAYQDAEKALKELHGVNIKGRAIKVDWALAKKDFDSKVTSMDMDLDESPSTKEEDELEIEDEDDQEMEEKDVTMMEEETPQVEQITEKKGLISGCTLFIRNLSFETTQDTLYKAFSTFGKLRYARITMDSITQHSKGSGFVCFFNTQDTLKCLEEYGQFETRKELQMGDNPNSMPLGKPQGKTLGKNENTPSSVVVPEPSLLLLNSSPFCIDGRFVTVSEAMSRNEAKKVTEANKLRNRETDKRNLYLIKEGVIFPDSEAASKLTPSEVSRRQKSYSERKRLISVNPNLFISKTRLSVRNLGLKVDDAMLRKVALESVLNFKKQVEQGKRDPLESEVLAEASKEGCDVNSPKQKIFIKQAKVLRSTDRIDPSTQLGRSKGYGFIEFKFHAHALACLRWMNNNPNAFPNFKNTASSESASVEENRSRPIVEFALENKLVLKRRVERSSVLAKRKSNKDFSDKNAQEKNVQDKKRVQKNDKKEKGFKKNEKKPFSKDNKSTTLEKQKNDKNQKRKRNDESKSKKRIKH